MRNLLKMERYQLSHNFLYWCGMVGIFLIGFFTAETYVPEVMGTTGGRLLPLRIFLTEWFMTLHFFSF